MLKKKHGLREYSRDLISLNEALAKEMYLHEAGNDEISDYMTSTASFLTRAVPHKNTNKQQLIENQRKPLKLRLTTLPCVYANSRIHRQ